MAQLSQSELQFLKYALGINQLTVGAEPLVGITRYFEQIVVPFLNYGTLTSSATVVNAVAPGNGPTSVALTLASAAGISVYDTVVVDVDASSEQATVSSVSGSVIVVQLTLSHGAVGAYPVEQEGGSSRCRYFMSCLRRIDQRIDRAGPKAGVKKADEVEFFGGAHGRAKEAGVFQTLESMRDHFRRELCLLLFGVGSIQELSRGGGGGRVSVY